MSITYTSRLNGESQKGTAQNLARYYEKMGYEAERDKDIVLSHLYFQHAEHYKRVNK